MLARTVISLIEILVWGVKAQTRTWTVHIYLAVGLMSPPIPDYGATADRGERQLKNILGNVTRYKRRITVRYGVAELGIDSSTGPTRDPAMLGKREVKVMSLLLGKCYPILNRRTSPVRSRSATRLTAICLLPVLRERSTQDPVNQH